MLKRLLTKKIKASSKSVLLLGPRQSGKSTLLKSLKPDKIINLANEAEFIRHVGDPDYFESEIAEHRFIFVDEVQRVPSLLNTIQSIVDDSKDKRPIIFLLSGSSARKLRRGQANLLPGRIFTFYIAGLSAQELDYKLDAKKAVSTGFLPEPYLSGEKDFAEKLLTSYSSTYLKEEIQAEALTRNLQGFTRFLNIVAESAGHILDFSKLSTKAKVARSSCVRFFEILEDTLIGYRVDVFQEAETADTIKHPKFYFFDPGVLNGLLGNFIASKDRMGVLFEHVIIAQLKNSAMALDKRIEIFYFRTRNDVEVDFIVKWTGKIYAIEVKSGTISKSDLSSLRIFRDYFPKVHKCFAVSPAEKRRVLDNIIICDTVELLKELGM